jgi:hypothetical protein
LADSLDAGVGGVAFQAQSVGEEVLELRDHFVNRDMCWCWILQYQINFLERIWLIQRDISPILNKRILRHLYFLQKSIQEHWQSNREVHSINPDIKLRTVIKSLSHHCHHNDLRRAAVRVVSYRGTLNGEILIACIVLEHYLDVLGVLAILTGEGEHNTLKVLYLLNVASDDV